MATSPSESTLEKILKVQTELTSANPEVPLLLQLITTRSKELVGGDGAVFELVEGEDLVYRAASGTAENQIGLRLKVNGSFSGLSLQSKEILYCIDSEEDNRVNREACRVVGLRSMIVVPLYFDSEVLGVLKVLSVKPSSFTESDISALNMLSGTMAAILHNAYRWAEREKRLQSMSYLASHDTLTGIYNRSAFYDYLRRGIAKLESNAISLTVAMFDLDGLKQVNDTYGHAAGDFYIAQFAKRLSNLIQDHDVFARLGGDEFGLILMNPEPKESVTSFLTSIAKLVEGEVNYESKPLLIKTSYGISHYPEDGKDLETLLAKADERMYENKRERKKNQSN
ncbi:diguanylate cyclase (GGDEF) domain protein [Leptospira yanagawae serovar Saopaulo str. Sao Paulo = ATCC 700523]|uniref:GGDEF domain-containing protein n=2 Tax=Leptospira yanagawae TaxID=293069 RepID=A0ABY2M6M1_9LEPT|nr:sensor domain-containing diguanylate cyclase [Leptospira yanagawae]EOQ90188.1 diguanylate cyclase (GGDEF) domain protein [Leptospira yanagawae serovar Saopaulo str. Sao Paulo = ATCC 700523]TGL26006.1 GGDEF domain-containing protein [Leptospira yanagawae]